jgi:plastocyanin
MKNFDFSPTAIAVPAGTTVIWKNLDTVVSADGLFRSKAPDQNDTFSFKFDKPGMYKYVCSIHPKMMATITVQ